MLNAGNRRRRRTGVYTLTLAVTWCAVQAVAVMAQVYENPKTKAPESASSLMEWGIAAVFLVGCLVVSFKPAQRSNLK